MIRERILKKNGMGKGGNGLLKTDKWLQTLKSYSMLK